MQGESPGESSELVSTAPRCLPPSPFHSPHPAPILQAGGAIGSWERLLRGHASLRGLAREQRAFAAAAEERRDGPPSQSGKGRRANEALRCETGAGGIRIDAARPLDSVRADIAGLTDIAGLQADGRRCIYSQVNQAGVRRPSFPADLLPASWP